jgi:hypothetical protein
MEICTVFRIIRFFCPSHANSNICVNSISYNVTFGRMHVNIALGKYLRVPVTIPYYTALILQFLHSVHAALASSQKTTKCNMPFYGKAFYRGSERQSKNPRTIYTLVGCGFFTIACGFIPYIVVQHMRPLNSREEVRCALKIFSFHC